jgi:hypothetical protein
LQHHVANRGAAERIHLVVDAKVNDWVRELFENGQSQRIQTCAPSATEFEAFREAVYFGEQRLTEPFFEDDVKRCLRAAELYAVSA